MHCLCNSMKTDKKMMFKQMQVELTLDLVYI